MNDHHQQALIEALARRRGSSLSQHPMMMEMATTPHQMVDKTQESADTNMASRMENESQGEESPGGTKELLPHNEMQTTASQMGLMHYEMGKEPYADGSLRAKALAEAEAKHKQKK